MKRLLPDHDRGENVSKKPDDLKGPGKEFALGGKEGGETNDSKVQALNTKGKVVRLTLRREQEKLNGKGVGKPGF